MSLLAIVCVGGCTIGSHTGNDYPSAQTTQSQAAAAQQDMLRVPAGAHMVAMGQPPLPGFTISISAGLLYIYDQNTSSVVKVTSFGGQARGQQIDLSQFSNLTNSLDPKHTYIIYIVPEENATTLPSPLP